MSNLEFIQQASIAAMQGLSTRSTHLTPLEIAGQAITRAEHLLELMKKNKYSIKDEETIEYIKDIDDLHGQQAAKLDERIEQLEFKLVNIIRILEGSDLEINKPMFIVRDGVRYNYTLKHEEG